VKRRRIALILVALSVALFGAAAAASTVSDLEKQLKKALSAGNKGKVLGLGEELLKTGEERAVEIVAGQALLVNSYDIERRLAGLLAALPPDLRGPVRKLALSHKRYEVRVILSAVLAAYDDDDSFITLCSMVRDPVPSVKLAAISRLVKKGDSRAIGVFINELAKWERYGGVVPADLRKALEVMTGESFIKAADWKKWWNISKSTFKGKKAPKKRKSHGRTAVRAPRASFFGHEIVSKKILFILDMSGSMHVRDEPVKGEEETPGIARKGTKVIKRRPKKKQKKGEEKKKELPLSRERLYRVQQELIRTISQLTPDTRFTVMAFNHKIKMLSETPQRATTAFKKKAKSFALSFRPEGETWTDAALRKAFELKNQIDTMYLLSDGAPRRNNKRLDEEKILKEVKEMNRFLKIKINTVGFLQAGSRMRRFLYTLARQNNGEYKELK